MIQFLNITFILLGFGAAIAGKRTGLIKNWRSGYLVIASGIFFAFGLLLVFRTGEAVLFLLFGIVGMVLEALLDFLYKKVSGQRFFSYRHMTIFGYGSFLSFPFWGTAGLLFWEVGNFLK